MPWPVSSGDQSLPGHGEINLTLLPPGSPSFKALRFSYPLKLVPSAPHILDSNASPVGPGAKPPQSSKGNLASSSGDDAPCQPPLRPAAVPLVFILSYGGGLLPADSLSLTITLEAGSRLTLATQGSTKIFPAPAAASSATTRESPPTAHAPCFPTATQNLHASLAPHSALLLAPDPVQPFARSRGAQHQRFDLAPGASLAVLDWVVEGRRARGESWRANAWRSCNEVWRVAAAAGAGSGADGEQDGSGQRPPRLMLRDAVLLGDEERDVEEDGGVGQRMLRDEGMGVFGSLILAGEAFRSLGKFFVVEFGALPRIGGRDWGDDDEGARDPDSAAEAAEMKRKRWREARLMSEKEDKVLWTAAKVRDCVLVKFAAKEVEGARRWLRDMWTWEGTISRDFGPGGMMCVK